MPYWKIQQANPAIDANQLSAGQVLTIPSKNEMLPLPVVTGKRIVISISQQRMWTYRKRGRTPGTCHQHRHRPFTHHPGHLPDPHP